MERSGQSIRGLLFDIAALPPHGVMNRLGRVVVKDVEDEVRLMLVGAYDAGVAGHMIGNQGVRADAPLQTEVFAAMPGVDGEYWFHLRCKAPVRIANPTHKILLVARKFLRRQQRSEGRWSPLEDAILTLQSITLSHTPSLITEAAIDAAQLRQAIAMLPLRYREVVVLCDLQEKEYAEAASILDCSIGTVRSRLHRGRNLLARKLNPNFTKKGDRHAL